MVTTQSATPAACSSALQACLDCSSMASCTAAKLGGRVAEAASACCGSLLRVESLIQLGLVPKPRSNMVRVPHMRQAHNWDCGLACVLMVLRTAGVHDEDLQSLRSRCRTTSIWTVDLAYILARCGLAVEFTTTHLGANPAYAKESFYREHMAEDGRRVERLFQEAGAAGIGVMRRSVRCRELKDRMLLGGCLVIALVDKTKLSGQAAVPAAPGGAQPLPQQPPPAPRLSVPQLRSSSNASYTGHYILLVGYDSETDRFMVQDPASAAELNSVTTASLEAARLAYGTDEDLLLISLPSSAPAFSNTLVAF